MEPLAELLERISGVTPADRSKLEETTKVYLKNNKIRWIPNPGPQTDAYFCKADLLLYGGEAGGGKSDLGLGLAFNEHQSTLIMRRENVQLGALLKRAIEINGTRTGFNGSSPPKLVTQDNRQIDFGAAQNPGDEMSWQGQPHDLIVFDEGVHFLESQIRFVIGWLRSTNPKQRKRVVIATNPPIDQDGRYIIDMFAPWLDPQYPNPASPGELRWFISNENGEDQEVEGPEPVQVGDKLVTPLSRTFIPASVEDNPFLARTNYKAQLDSLPEPLRSALRDGNFLISREDDFNQVIPTAWIREAQARWRPIPPVDVPMCAIGTDVARGGKDFTVLARRYDGWFAPLIKVPGAQTPLGTDVAGLVLSKRLDNALVIIDMGGGYGGEPYGHLMKNGVDVVAWLGVDPTSERTADRKLGFANKRSMAIWRFREALDPAQPGGSGIMLPPDNKLVADLVAPRFTVTSRGITVESKEDIVKRLGRSPDDGDAVVMAWTSGQKAAMQKGGWKEASRRRWNPTSNLGPRGPLARRAS